jgi:ribosome-associated toxin RatA of RatAB toxin-antitoxin module
MPYSSQGFPYKAVQAVILLITVLTTGFLSAAQAQEDGLMMLSVVSTPNLAGMKKVQAKIVIDAPPSLVWQTLTNYADLQNVLPGYEKSTVIRAKGTNKLLDIAMKVAAFLPTYRYRVQIQEHEADYLLNMNRISGDFKSMDATYKLLPQNNGTRTILVYNLNIDTGLNVPGSQGIIRANAEKTLKALERHIEQEARKSVIGQQ